MDEASGEEVLSPPLPPEMLIIEILQYINKTFNKKNTLIKKAIWTSGGSCLLLLAVYPYSLNPSVGSYSPKKFSGYSLD